MNTLTADASLHQSLTALSDLTEIRDSHGKVIGFFSPAGDETGSVYCQAATYFDPDEMRRRKESGEKGLTTSEVLDHLRSLEN